MTRCCSRPSCASRWGSPRRRVWGRRAAGSRGEPRSLSTAIRSAVFFGPLRGSNLVVVSGGPSVLNLRLNSRPDTAGLVRAVIGGLAAPFALRTELVNDLKTVVSEACNNAVDHAYRGESGTIAVRLDVQLEEIEMTVRDWGGGFQQVAPAGDHLRVGLPLINALADRAEFLTAPGSGTEVRMGFDLRHDPRRTDMLVRVEDSEDLEAWIPWRRGLTGDVVVTLCGRAARQRARAARECPGREVAVLAGAVLRRLHRDARGGQARASGRQQHPGQLLAHRADQRLELTIGPLKTGSGERLQAIRQASDEHDASVVEPPTSRIRNARPLELLRMVLDRPRARSERHARPALGRPGLQGPRATRRRSRRLRPRRRGRPSRRPRHRRRPSRHRRRPAAAHQGPSGPSASAPIPWRLLRALLHLAATALEVVGLFVEAICEFSGFCVPHIRGLPQRSKPHTSGDMTGGRPAGAFSDVPGPSGRRWPGGEPGRAGRRANCRVRAA